MADEIALTTDSSSDSPCVFVWETSTWMQIRAYKPGVCSRRCLCSLTQDYILAAQTNKPLLHVWDFSKEQMHCKIICPGNISALAVSPNGSYCAGACSERIYIWQIATGNLLRILSRHFQPVTCLKFTDDSSHLISGADDNLVLVWPLVRVLTFSSSHQRQDISPKHTWSNHSLPITSIYVGYGGTFSRVVTSSLDQTCKLWDLASGHLLRSFVFNVAILAVVMDAAEYRLFAGGYDGKVFVINLFCKESVKESLEDEREKPNFTGHSKQVTSLSLSMDGLRLLSGSKDCTARVWDIPSGQCLRVLEHKGCVDNVQILPCTPYLDGSKRSKSSFPVLGTFKRNLYSFGEISDPSNQANKAECLPIRVFNSISWESHEERKTMESELLHKVLRENCNEVQQRTGDQMSLSKAELEEQLEKSKQLTQTLYQFAVEEILTEARSELRDWNNT